MVTPAHRNAQLWAVRIEAAQAPLLMSSRDGRLLRPVPLEARLAPGALREALILAAGGRLAADARSLLCGAWQRGPPPTGSLSWYPGPLIWEMKPSVKDGPAPSGSLSCCLARFLGWWS